MLVYNIKYNFKVIPKMNILIVNDDGLTNKNVLTLQNLLKNYGNVYVCVPDGERSGSSHSTHKYEILAENFFKSEKYENVYTHTGTASDSVKFFLKFVTKEIDYVVSGINAGFNLGIDTVYSGTVGAALEANLYGIKSIALSARKNGNNYWTEIPKLFNYLFNRFNWGSITCLNINFPDGESPFKYIFTPVAQIKKPDSGDNDFNLCRNKGYATISPITADITDYENLAKNLKSDEAI